MNLLEELTQQTAIKNFISITATALIINGEESSVLYVAKFIAETILSADDLDTYPYALRISTDKRSIGIEQIREIHSFLSLKVPNQDGINRVVLIESGDKMTRPAQTALLKTLEDSSEQNLIIITSSSITNFLPTVMSRCHVINLSQPSKASIDKYFSDEGYDLKAINLSYLISRGSVDKIGDILSDPNHPLLKAADDARELLKSDTYHRLIILDGLSKQRERLLDVAYVLQQMSRVSLNSNDEPAALKRWQRVFSSANQFEISLKANVNTKLAALKLALSL